MQRVLGTLQWLGQPASEINFLLSPAYNLLREERLPRRLPRRIYLGLLRAAVLTSLPVFPRPLPPPLTLPPIFYDAAPSSSTGFRVGAFRRGTLATSCCCPAYIQSINQAEIYAAFHTLRQAVKRRFAYVTLLGDNSTSFYDLLQARCCSSGGGFARVLSQVWRLVNRHHMRFGFGPSSLSPKCG